VRIGKRGGGDRWLSVPSVADRVAQTAWLWALAPAFEARMHPASYGYRPGLGVDDAVRAARAHVAAGRDMLARIDIEGFFDNVPHGRLFAELRGWVFDKRLLAQAQDWARTAAPRGRGLPQGSPISPALANVFLDPIDRAMAAEGMVAVRYADDIAVFARSASEARAALVRIGELLSARGLALNMAKSRVTRADGETLLGKPLAPRRSRWARTLGKISRTFFSRTRPAVNHAP
jgi:retron-type reverse transcriptase